MLKNSVFKAFLLIFSRFLPIFCVFYSFLKKCVFVKIYIIVYKNTKLESQKVVKK